MHIQIRLPGSAFRSLAPLVAVCLMVVATAACGSSTEGDSVTGIITSVEPRSITEFDSITVVDEDGRSWRFVGGLFAGFTPSHLQEHMALREPVRVWYTEGGDGELRVTRIEDG